MVRGRDAAHAAAAAVRDGSERSAPRPGCGCAGGGGRRDSRRLARPRARARHGPCRQLVRRQLLPPNIYPSKGRPTRCLNVVQLETQVRSVFGASRESLVSARRLPIWRQAGLSFWRALWSF